MKISHFFFYFDGFPWWKFLMFRTDCCAGLINSVRNPLKQWLSLTYQSLCLGNWTSYGRFGRLWIRRMNISHEWQPVYLLPSVPYGVTDSIMYNAMCAAEFPRWNKRNMLLRVSGSPGFHLMVLTCKLINYVFTSESVHCQVNSHHIPCTHSAPPEYFYSNNV